jgi:hypothetical protein
MFGRRSGLIQEDTSTVEAYADRDGMDSEMAFEDAFSTTYPILWAVATGRIASLWKQERAFLCLGLHLSEEQAGVRAAARLSAQAQAERVAIERLVTLAERMCSIQNGEEPFAYICQFTGYAQSLARAITPEQWRAVLAPVERNNYTYC